MPSAAITGFKNRGRHLRCLNNMNTDHNNPTALPSAGFNENDASGNSGFAQHPPASPPKNRFELPDPRSSTVLPIGLWGNPPESESLWRDCMAGLTSKGSFAEKFRATALLHGYSPSEDGGIRLANMAWFNGAAACKKELRLESVLEIIGNRQKTGKALLAAVQNIKGVAGSGIGPLWDQRTILSQIRKQTRFQKLKFDSWIGACVVGGWFAYQEDHLVTHLAFSEPKTEEFHFLSNQIINAVIRTGPKFDEALAREIALRYESNEALESIEVGRAVERSLAAARASGWGACGFLLDGFGQGQHLARNHPERVVPILNELGDRLGRMLQVFDILFDEDLNNATEGVAWRKFVQIWIPFAQSTTFQVDDRDSGLVILRRAYDGLFWIGALREMMRICEERGG